MKFERTAFGLSNRNIFVGSDITVYTESNPDFPETHKCENIFWKRVLQRKFPGKRLKFVAKGNKEALKNLISIIEKDQAAEPRSVICIDRDLDDFTAGIIDKEFVFYSHGYSFENDVFNIETVLRYFHAIVADDDLVDDVIRRFRSCLANLIFRFRRVFYHDCHKNYGVIDRKKYKKIFVSFRVWKSSVKFKSTSRYRRK